jgi:uncharacterized protein YndB with AHSA1/START domain
VTAAPYRTSADIAAPPQAVYPYLTRPEAIVSRIGDYPVPDAVPGGQFHLDINGVPARGRYLEPDPPHRLLISRGHPGSGRLPPGSSTVKITPTPTPDGTHVTVEHRDLPPEQAAQHAAGWPHFPARLTAAATGHDPGPDPYAQATARPRDDQPPPLTRQSRRSARLPLPDRAPSQTRINGDRRRCQCRASTPVPAYALAP